MASDADILAIDGGTPVRTVPFPAREPFGPADLEQLRSVIEQQTAFFPLGSKVYEFERRFRDLYSVAHATASTSGTSAIHVALGALDLEPGDEVITTPLSDMGTVAPTVLCGCVPIFADLKLGTFNLDPESVRERITDRTRALIIVHCWGQPAEMDELMAIAREHDLRVIEDCSQAHLTRYRGKLVGTIGYLGAFSLQDSKHLQCGDGGVTITDDEALGARAAVYVDKGCDWTEDRAYRLRYAFIAPCYRMTEWQGAILCSQLDRLEWIVRTRQRLGDRLLAGLQGVPGIHPPERTDGAEHSYWHFPLRVDSDVLGVTRERFIEMVHAEGVPLGGGWIGKLLYEFGSLRDRIAFGSSNFPWDYGRQEPVSYHTGLCPNAEQGVAQLCVLAFNERWSERDIDEAAEGVAKVARICAERAGGA